MFLLADISMDMVFGMLFLTPSNVDIKFVERKLIQKTYIIKDVLLTTCRIKFINKKKFAKIALDENIKVFVIHVNSLNLGSRMTIYPAEKCPDSLVLG